MKKNIEMVRQIGSWNLLLERLLGIGEMEGRIGEGVEHKMELFFAVVGPNVSMWCPNEGGVSRYRSHHLTRLRIVQGTKQEG